MYLKSDILGRTEIMGDGNLVQGPSSDVGLIFGAAQPVASISQPQPIKYAVTVYQQFRRRIGGALYWERDTDFTASTPEEALKNAQEYVTKKGWQMQSQAAVSGADAPASSIARIYIDEETDPHGSFFVTYIVRSKKPGDFQTFGSRNKKQSISLAQTFAKQEGLRISGKIQSGQPSGLDEPAKI